MFPWQSRPISIISSLSAVSSLFLDTCVLNVELANAAKSKRRGSRQRKEKFHLCGVSLQIRIPSFTQGTVSVRCREKGLLLAETDPYSIELRRSIASRGIMNMLPNVTYNIYIANISTKPVSLPNYMIVPSAANATTCIVPVLNNKPDTIGKARLNNSARDYNLRVDTKKVTLPTATGSLRPLLFRNINKDLNSVHYREKIAWTSIHNSLNETTRKKTNGKARYMCPTITSHIGPNFFNVFNILTYVGGTIRSNQCGGTADCINFV